LVQLLRNMSEALSAASMRCSYVRMRPKESSPIQSLSRPYSKPMKIIPRRIPEEPTREAAMAAELAQEPGDAVRAHHPRRSRQMMPLERTGAFTLACVAAPANGRCADRNIAVKTRKGTSKNTCFGAICVG